MALNTVPAVQGENGVSFDIDMSESAAPGIYNYSIKNTYAAPVDEPPNTYGSLTISYPKQLQASYPDMSASLPAGWELTASEGDINTLSFIKNIEGEGTAPEQLVDFLNQVSFTMKDADEFPPEGSAIGVIVDATMISFMVIDGIRHYYRFTPTDASYPWMTAYNESKKQTYRGMKGYLATITSQAEQDFIYNSIAKRPGWLGGTRVLREIGNPKIEDDNAIVDPQYDTTILNDNYNMSPSIEYWYWADGPEAGLVFYRSSTLPTPDGIVDGVYSFFSPGEPNASLYENVDIGHEAFLQFAYNNLPNWNDLAYTLWYGVGGYDPDTFVQGYYTEFSQYGDQVEQQDNGGHNGPLVQPIMAFYRYSDTTAENVSEPHNQDDELAPSVMLIGNYGEPYHIPEISPPYGYEVKAEDESRADAGVFTDHRQEITVYYAPKEVTIKLDVGNKEIAYKVTFNQPYGELPTPTRRGYTFLGWSLSPDGSEPFDQSALINSIEEHTLYAQWDYGRCLSFINKHRRRRLRNKGGV